MSKDDLLDIKQQGLCILTVSTMKTLYEEQLTTLKSCPLNSITFHLSLQECKHKTPPTLVSNLNPRRSRVSPEIIWF